MSKRGLCGRVGRWAGRTCGLLRTPPSWRSRWCSTWWPSSSSASTRAPGRTLLKASGTKHQPQDYLGHMSADLTGNRATQPNILKSSLNFKIIYSLKAKTRSILTSYITYCEQNHALNTFFDNVKHAFENLQLT
jgi:hypothetical protein